MLKPPAAGKGRPRGSPNKISATLKEAIELTFTRIGGVDYLVRQAEENPVAFMALLGKLIPRDLNVSGSINVDAIAERLARARERTGQAEAARPQ